MEKRELWIDNWSQSVSLQPRYGHVLRMVTERIRSWVQVVERTLLCRVVGLIPGEPQCKAVVLLNWEEPMEKAGAVGCILLELYQASTTGWKPRIDSWFTEEIIFHSWLWNVQGSPGRSWNLWLETEKSGMTFIASHHYSTTMDECVAVHESG